MTARIRRRRAKGPYGMSMEKPGKSGASLGRAVNWADNMPGRVIKSHRGAPYQSSGHKRWGPPATRNVAPPMKKGSASNTFKPSSPKQQNDRIRGRAPGSLWKDDYRDPADRPRSRRTPKPSSRRKRY